MLKEMLWGAEDVTILQLVSGHSFNFMAKPPLVPLALYVC